MKTTRILILTLALACLLTACRPGGAAIREPQARADSFGRLFQGTSLAPPTCGTSCSKEPPSGCSVFTVSKGDRVFFGGNDDYIHPDSYYWV